MPLGGLRTRFFKVHLMTNCKDGESNLLAWNLLFRTNIKMLFHTLHSWQVQKENEGVGALQGVLRLDESSRVVLLRGKLQQQNKILGRMLLVHHYRCVHVSRRLRHGHHSRYHSHSMKFCVFILELAVFSR